MDRRRFLACAVALFTAPGIACADDEDDADRALRERAKGRLLPLKDIIAIVRRAVPGRIVETEFDYDDDVPEYEFYVIRPDGRRVEVKVDGRSGRIIEIDED